MSNPKIVCLPPVANTLRDLHMRFTWVYTTQRKNTFLIYKTKKLSYFDNNNNVYITFSSSLGGVVTNWKYTQNLSSKTG